MELRRGPRLSVLKQGILDALRAYGARTKDQLVQDLNGPIVARLQAALNELDKECLIQVQEEDPGGNHLWKLTRAAKSGTRPGKAMGD